MTNKAATRSGGRPAFTPTAEQRRTVKMMVAYGIPQDEICRVILNRRTGRAISPATLRKHFRSEIETGATLANSKVVESLYKKAVEGNVPAQIWWTKVRLGWRDTRTSEPRRDDSVEALLEAVDGKTRGLPKSG